MQYNPISKSHRQFKQWHNAMHLIKLLHLLCLDIRSHRGASTALIGGDTFFKPIADYHALQVLEKFDAISTYLRKGGQQTSLLAGEVFFDLHKQWQNLQKDWLTQPQLNNFDRHCEILQSIQDLIWQLALEADNGVLGNSDKALLSRFILKHQAIAMESIARVRGFACTFCANGHMSNDQRELISLELEQLLMIWDKRLNTQHHLSLEHHARLQSLSQQDIIHQDLMLFLQLVKPMCSEGALLPNGSEVFNQANKVLNLLNVQYLNGLDTLKHNMPKELLNWIFDTEKTPLEAYI